MTESDKPVDIAEVPDAVIDAERKGLPVVWLLPLIAALIGGWLLIKTVSEKGPEFVISFKTAEGIEEGKTAVKYRDVTIGTVLKVRFADNLSHVLVTAQLVPGMERHLTEGTKFWVVRPRIGGGEVSGLGTLISGAYIAMDPGDSGKATRGFTGLEKPPVVTSDVNGTIYRLQADKLGSLTVGSPIYFRQFLVGEVIEYALAQDHESVEIGIFIRAPHDRFVLKSTRFWNAGGLDLAMDTSGVRVEVESVLSLVSGGIAFGNRAHADNREQAPENAVFQLYDSFAESQEDPITTGYRYMLTFSESLRGLNVGAPVEFRGVRLGTVKMIETRLVEQNGEYQIPVYIDLEPQRTISREEIEGLSGDALELRVKKQVEKLVSNGLRARLQSGSLLTGQLFVELDIFPDEKPAVVSYSGDYPKLPTIPGTLSGLATSVAQVLDKLEKAPLEQTLANMNELMVSTQRLVTALDREAPELASEAHAAMRAATSTLDSLQGVTSTDGEIGRQLHKTLEELSRAARSIRVMAEYLERHPEAMIKGKGNNP